MGYHFLNKIAVSTHMLDLVETWTLELGRPSVANPKSKAALYIYTNPGARSAPGVVYIYIYINCCILQQFAYTPPHGPHQPLPNFFIAPNPVVVYISGVPISGFVVQSSQLACRVKFLTFAHGSRRSDGMNRYIYIYIQIYIYIY